MQAKLVVVGGDANVRQYDLDLPTIIGRSRSTDVMLVHPLVSRQHCEVFEANGMLMVRDLGSRNGTFVGDTRIAGEAMPVKPGDLLTVGGVTFKAVYLAGDEPRHADWHPASHTVESPLPFESDLGKDSTMRRPDLED